VVTAVITRSLRLPAAALAALAALSCNTGFEPQYRVTDLRILGVRASALDGRGQPGLSADVTVEDDVQLEVLLANPLGRAAPRVRWYSCLPADREAASPCLEPEFLKDPAGLAAAFGARQIAEGVAPVLSLPDFAAAAGPALADLVEAALVEAEQKPSLRCLLFLEVPIVVVAEAEGRREVALKRVRLVPTDAELASHPGVNQYVRNLNPDPDRTGAVRALPGEEDCAPGDLPLTPMPPERTFLCARADAEGTYGTCDAGGATTQTRESYSFQWYATGGEFPEFDGRGNATGGSVEFARPQGPFTLWMIVRDGRGGESWKEYLIGP
jgi:hypothetical protein